MITAIQLHDMFQALRFVGYRRAIYEESRNHYQQAEEALRVAAERLEVHARMLKQAEEEADRLERSFKEEADHEGE